MQPSPTGYNLSTADLQRANIQPEVLGKIILQKSGPPDVTALLAALLKSQQKSNAHFLSKGFSFPIWNIQSLFTENPTRNYLLVQNTGNGDLFLTFEAGPTDIQDYSAGADTQQQLTNIITRAIRIFAGGSYEPLVAPRNSLTIFTTSAATTGVAIEGN